MLIFPALYLEAPVVKFRFPDEVAVAVVDAPVNNEISPEAREVFELIRIFPLPAVPSPESI